MRSYVAIIEWHDDEVNDADEIAVYAKNVAEAKRKARQRWRATKGAAFPSCRIDEVLVITRSRLRKILARQ